MSVITPDNAEQVIQEIQQDVKDELLSSNPWLESGFIRALAVGNGRRGFDLYEAIERGIELGFPFKAIGKFLQYWATLKNMSLLLATKSNGPVTVTGTLGTTISQGWILKIGSVEYVVDTNVNIEVNTRNVSQLSAAGTVAVCRTTEDHNLANGNSVTIDGANQSEWNDTWEDVTIIDAQNFQFTVPAGISSPTGTMTIEHTAALITITSSEVGSYNNEGFGVPMEFSQSHSGVDDIAGIQFEGLTGGSDDETTAEYSKRIIHRWQNPETPLNGAKISRLIRELPGNKNTRVWVRRVRPVVGAMSIYFVRDNDESIMPDASEIAEAKAAVMEIMSPQTEEEDVHVNDPFVGVPVTTVISQLDPNTSTMQESMRSAISTYFRGNGLGDGPGEGENIVYEQYRSELSRVTDYQTGERVKSFTLSQPVANVQIDEGEIAIEGTTNVG